MHEGEDHSMILPRLAEAESWERLDGLLAEINTGESSGRSDLVVEHVACLFARIEASSTLDTWPIVQGSPDTSPRWIEIVVGIEIDRAILRILQNEGACVDCVIAWAKHLIEARITLSEWAWARDADALFG